MATEMMRNLRFTTREVKMVETMVLYHLRPGQMSQQGMPTDRAIYRYFRDTGEAGIDILFLNLADHLAARGPHLSATHWSHHADVVRYVLERQASNTNIISPPRLLTGDDLIAEFGLSPGRRIGELLESLREAQASGEIRNREEALAFIRSRIA
jgi:poly(A) polymerase